MDRKTGIFILAGITIVSTAFVVGMDIATQRLIDSMCPEDCKKSDKNNIIKEGTEDGEKSK